MDGGGGLLLVFGAHHDNEFTVQHYRLLRVCIAYTGLCHCNIAPQTGPVTTI